MLCRICARYYVACVCKWIEPNVNCYTGGRWEKGRGRNKGRHQWYGIWSSATWKLNKIYMELTKLRIVRAFYFVKMSLFPTVYQSNVDTKTNRNLSSIDERVHTLGWIYILYPEFLTQVGFPSTCFFFFLYGHFYYIFATRRVHKHKT